MVGVFSLRFLIVTPLANIVAVLAKSRQIRFYYLSLFRGVYLFQKKATQRKNLKKLLIVIVLHLLFLKEFLIRGWHTYIDLVMYRFFARRCSDSKLDRIFVNFFNL